MKFTFECCIKNFAIALVPHLSTPTTMNLIINSVKSLGKYQNFLGIHPYYLCSVFMSTKAIFCINLRQLTSGNFPASFKTFEERDIEARHCFDSRGSVQTS